MAFAQQELPDAAISAFLRKCLELADSRNSAKTDREKLRGILTDEADVEKAMAKYFSLEKKKELPDDRPKASEEIKQLFEEFNRRRDGVATEAAERVNLVLVENLQKLLQRQESLAKLNKQSEELKQFAN